WPSSGAGRWWSPRCSWTRPTRWRASFRDSWRFYGTAATATRRSCSGCSSPTTRSPGGRWMRCTATGPARSGGALRRWRSEPPAPPPRRDERRDHGGRGEYRTVEARRPVGADRQDEEHRAGDGGGGGTSTRPGREPERGHPHVVPGPRNRVEQEERDQRED